MHENTGLFLAEVPEAAATGAVADYFAVQRDAWGFLPNYAQCFVHRPEVAAAWASLNGAIRTGMDRRRYELVTIAAARELGSTYCTTAHSTFLRDDCDDEESLRSIAAAPDGSQLEPLDRAVYRFATQVARDATTIERADVAVLQAAGLTDRDIADIVYAVAARSFFATILDALGARLDARTAARFEPELLQTMVVGRQPAPAAGPG